MAIRKSYAQKEKNGMRVQRGGETYRPEQNFAKNLFTIQRD